MKARARAKEKIYTAKLSVRKGRNLSLALLDLLNHIITLKSQNTNQRLELANCIRILNMCSIKNPIFFQVDTYES